MKAFSRIGLLLLLLMGGLVYGADYFDLPWMSSIALMGVGLIACVGGIRVLVKGEAYEDETTINPRYIRRYTGVSAWMIGLALLLAGPIIIALSWRELFNPGAASAFLAGLPDLPYGWALILGVAGLFVTAFGVVRILSGTGTRSGAWGPFVEFTTRIGGVFSVLVGLALLSLAAGTFLAPDLLKELFDQAVRLAGDWVLNQ